MTHGIFISCQSGAAPAAVCLTTLFDRHCALHGKAVTRKDDGKPEDRPVTNDCAKPGVRFCRLVVRSFLPLLLTQSHAAVVCLRVRRLCRLRSDRRLRLDRLEEARIPEFMHALRAYRLVEIEHFYIRTNSCSMDLRASIIPFGPGVATLEPYKSGQAMKIDPLITTPTTRHIQKIAP